MRPERYNIPTMKEHLELADAMAQGSAEIRNNIRIIHETVLRACRKSGRKAQEVRCVAVSKGHPASAARLAVEAGLRDIAENRVQEASAKILELSDISARWHLIGTLQINKVRLAVRHFSMIQSLDRIELAAAIQRECEKQNRTMDVLIQVEATGEPTKHGIRLEGVSKLASALKDFSRLRLRGLMAIGPMTEDRQEIRTCFRALHGIFQSLRSSADREHSFDTLSMGMSHDFEMAVEEGSTMIRVGTLIFGPRPAK